MNLMIIISFALGALLFIGILFGLLRSWQKSLIRVSLVVLSFVVALLLAPKIASGLMTKYVDGLVLSIFGQTINIESIIGEIAGDLLSEGSTLTNFATAILNIIVRLVAFLIVFIALLIVTLIVYYVISAIMSSRQKSKSVGKVKPKAWERLVGAAIGLVGSLVICLALFTPVFGVMNVCDKFLETETKNTASAYNSSLVCGKFYTENKQIGKVESYLEKYEKLRNDYKKSFAGIVFTYTGIDAIGKATFNNLSTVTHNGLTVNLTDECVNIGKVYNIYKDSFVKNKFDLSKNETVDSIQKMYNIAKNSEVMKGAIVEYIPKMSTKWASGEKFLGAEIPVQGDLKDIVVDLLVVYDTEDFSTLDKNINITFEAIKIANEHEIISSVNGGAEILDVLDNGTFVKDEINNLSSSADFRRVLPNVLTTTIKIAYKSVLDDPGTKLNQEFTQTQLAEIVWNDEAEISQTVVSNMLSFMDTENVVDCLTDFGEVIDSSRQSKILSKPVKILMSDYIDVKVTELNESARTVLVDSLKDENWNSSSYSYRNLFRTVQTTAKVADNKEGTKFTDIPLDTMLEGDTDGQVKDTIQKAVDAGVLKDLVDDNKKAEVYEDLITSVLDNHKPGESVEKDMKAGQVVTDIINNSSADKSMFGENKNDEAASAVNNLISSGSVMDVLDAEAQKVEASESSSVKSYIDTMNDADKAAFENAINNMEAGDNKNTLATLFGVTIA